MTEPELMSSLTKSDLIDNLSKNQGNLIHKDVKIAVYHLLKIMGDTLSTGGRIEIRGFGSFRLHYHPPRTGRNPKSGEVVNLSGKYVPHFKPGKELRERVNGKYNL